MKHKTKDHGRLNMSDVPQISLLTAQEILLTARNTKMTEDMREDEIKTSMMDCFAGTLNIGLIQYMSM